MNVVQPSRLGRSEPDGGGDAPIFDPRAFRLTEAEAALLDRVRHLAAANFAPRAAAYDREARFPTENYRDLHEAGLLAICIPEAQGGLGASYRTYSLAGAEIGRYCGATALTWNMHVCSTLWSGALADDLDIPAAERAAHERRRALHYRRIVEDGAIYSQPFSEGGPAAAGSAAFGTEALPADGGWRVSGTKIFASLSGHADYYGILCTERGPDERASRRNTLYLAIPADAPGVSVSGDWDPLGMRGTVSRTLRFKDVFVAEDAALMPRGVYAQAASRWPHMFLTLSPTYMGLAQAAYDFTVRYLRGEAPGTPPVRRRQYPTKQLAVAEMRIKLEAAKALWFQAVSEAGPDPSKEQVMRAWAAQYTVMETANDLARLAIRTCGGQAMLRALPLERLYRDSRCGSLMLPWTAELCLDRLGRAALYDGGGERSSELLLHQHARAAAAAQPQPRTPMLSLSASAQAAIALQGWMSAWAAAAEPWRCRRVRVSATAVGSVAAWAQLQAQASAQLGLDLTAALGVTALARLTATLNARLSAIAALNLNLAPWIGLAALNSVTPICRRCSRACLSASVLGQRGVQLRAGAAVLGRAGCCRRSRRCATGISVCAGRASSWRRCRRWPARSRARWPTCR